MRCIRASEEKLELVGNLWRKAGLGEHSFDFQFCDNQNIGQSFEKRQIYTNKTQNFPLFTLKLLWKKVTTMVGL